MPALVLSAAVAAGAAPASDTGVAFSATASPRRAELTLRPHVEVVARLWGTWDRPPDWRWRSDSAQIAWMLANGVEPPRCRVVLRRRISESQSQSASSGSPPPSGRALVKRILAVPESRSLPAREFVVPLPGPDAEQPPAECVDDPRAPLRARLAELESGAAACASAAAEAETRIEPLHAGLVAAAADSHRRCGDLVGMERILRTAVGLYEEHHPNHPERPQALYELGTLLISQGRLREGEVQVRRAVDLTLAAGVQGAELAIAIEELAQLYEALEQADEATRRWIQAIALHEKAARAAGLAPASHLGRLAEQQRALKQLRAARLYARRADQLALLQRSR